VIRRLVDGTDIVEVQDTAFSLDVPGRYVCNTWDEAVNNGGFPFDVVVIGAGMYGAYIAEKIYRDGAAGNLRVLVLEAGPFLVSEHIQNLTQMGLNVPGPTSTDPGVARERVWGLPWRSQTGFPGLAYCVGGRSLYWGGWSPRLTAADLAQWPPEIANYLNANYGNTEREIGVTPTTDFISGPLFDELMSAFGKAVLSVTGMTGPPEEAPLAVQGSSPSPGVFPFDKYSSAPIFMDAVREAAGSPDATRRLFVVPRAHVVRLLTGGGLVTGIELNVNGQNQALTIGPNCAVVLAASTIESTRLALESFPAPKMGSNLMAHLRSNTTVRIKRAAFSPSLPKQLETAALLVRGATPQGRYHFQVTAAAVLGANPEAVLFRMIPDIDLLDRTLAGEQSDTIVITLRGIGEMTGDKNSGPQSTATSWMDLSPFERDEFGARRAWINLVATANQQTLWNAMDQAAIALAQTIAKTPANIEYFYDNTWNSAPPPPGKVRDGLGTTHHEAGTMWMGTDPANSVTDLNGRFHHIGNSYAAGPALFPTLGSANPSATAFTLARRTAAAVVTQLAPAAEPGLTRISTASLADWQMAGTGQFNLVGGDIFEAQGGIGLLWYTKQQFADFLLKVDWRASSPTDNSGVFLRFPKLGNADPANDWRLAVSQGFEIQIDDTGFNPDNNTFNDPLHMTGAVYTLAPAARLASRPVGQWNTYEITCVGPSITVKLNGEVVSQLTHDTGRPAKGHIGLQNHHPGSRVQFRNIRFQQIGAAVKAGA
jgi:3-keto-disaccharide hydrolase/GMC oxidoreductase